MLISVCDNEAKKQRELNICVMYSTLKKKAIKISNSEWGRNEKNKRKKMEHIQQIYFVFSR
jgi:hypothetical protein